VQPDQKTSSSMQTGLAAPKEKVRGAKGRYGVAAQHRAVDHGAAYLSALEGPCRRVQRRGRHRRPEDRATYHS
jgi:hypothetical protein